MYSSYSVNKYWPQARLVSYVRSGYIPVQSWCMQPWRIKDHHGPTTGQGLWCYIAWPSLFYLGLVGNALTHWLAQILFTAIVTGLAGGLFLRGMSPVHFKSITASMVLPPCRPTGPKLISGLQTALYTNAKTDLQEAHVVAMCLQQSQVVV